MEYREHKVLRDICLLLAPPASYLGLRIIVIEKAKMKCKRMWLTAIGHLTPRMSVQHRALATAAELLVQITA